MKYALAKFRVCLIGDIPFIVYTDDASLSTAVNNPHLLQRMAKWLSFFVEYKFSIDLSQDDLMSLLTHSSARLISNRLRHPTLVRPLSRY